MAYVFGDINDEKNKQLIDLFLKGAPGAYSIGTEVIKISSEKDDFAENGDRGIVKGSIAVPKGMGPFYKGNETRYLYLVTWDHDKDSSSIVINLKIDNIK